MTDDLVDRLLFGVFTVEETIALRDEAADRIQKLETALREIAALGFWDGDSAMSIASKALEGKND